MALKMFSLKAFFFLHKFLLKFLVYPQSLQRKHRNAHDSRSQFPKYPLLAYASKELASTVLVFDVEGALLRSTSLFPYFMLVAFEAGGLVRALALLLSYPIICLVCKELGLKIMVFVCFFGIKERNFNIGRTVLPKFFLEDVGHEGFDMVMRYGRKVGMTELPTVMVDVFLKDYLSVEAIFGRKLKVAFGYFIGLMEAKGMRSALLNDLFEEKVTDSHLIGFGRTDNILDQQFLSNFKEIYMVTEVEKRSWQVLPREKYPKQLIFHDGRLAFRPTFPATLAMFMWIPLGFLLCIFRAAIGILLPYELSVPLLAFTGMRAIVLRSGVDDTINKKQKQKGTLYVCNHKTLLDPVYISVGLRRQISAVTYSISRTSELLSPITTAHLTRNKDQDSRMMEKLLSHSDLVVCPEGTTCREPYLLRFSPLFAELSDEIVPVAIDVHVSMFYGTTASGLKCLDPLFFLMNPYTTYSVRFLEQLPRSYTCWTSDKSRIEVANHVQKEIAEALKFQCTSLTRKDKYMILAGNEGTI